MRHLLVLALLASNPVADASCMRMELNPSLLTRRDTHVPADGGILVGYGFTTSSDELEATNSNDPSDVKWTARDAHKKPIALVHTVLAPGLSVLRPAGTAAFTLVSSKGKQLGAFTRDGKQGALVAPEPKLVETTSSKASNPRWGSTTTVSLTLAAAAPPEAVAIIAYGEDGKPLRFTGLADTHDQDLSLDLSRSDGHCGTSEPRGAGTIAGKVTFAYVDAFGRLSPQSKPIAVKG